MNKIQLFIVLIFIFLGYSCADDMEIKVSEINILNIDENGLTIEAESTFQVEVMTRPENAARAGITYKSSNEDIFTVSARGVLTAHSTGEAELTVKTQDGTYLNDSRNILVIPKTIPVESIEILNLDEDGTLTIPYESRYKIHIAITPENANTAVSYHSSDQTVFTVDEEGYTMGLVNEGEAELIVRSVRNPDISISCPVKVKDLSIQDIILPEESISLKNLGDQYDLGEKMTLLPLGASKDNVTYSSSNDEVASVSAEGVITAKGKGEITITIKSTDGMDIEKTLLVDVEAELHYDGWTVTASSYNASQGTPGAILQDGAAPFWHSQWQGATAELPHWLLIDMQSERLITEVLVERRWTNTDLRKATVEISLDGETFTQVGILDWTGVPSADFARSATFAKQKVRFIKVTVTESNRSPFASINRLRVYGASE